MTTEKLFKELHAMALHTKTQVIKPAKSIKL